MPRNKFFTAKTLGIPIGTVLVFLIPILLINLRGEVYLQSVDDYFLNATENESTRKIIEAREMYLKQDSLNLDKHYEYVKIATKHGYYSDVVKLKRWYDSFLKNRDSNIRDIANLMNGFIDFYQKKSINYSRSFDQVNNDSIKYLSYGYGLVYLQEANYLEAEIFFRKELENNGSAKEATIGLFTVYSELKDFKSLNKLAYNDKTYPHLERGYKMDVYYRDGAWLPYFREALNRHYEIINWFGFIGALLATLVWVFYLRSLDVFEPEKWKNIIAMFLMGTVFVFLVYPLSDFIQSYLGAFYTGSSWSQLLYCIVNIGVVEELVKIIPWVLLLKFTKVMDEPFDYILYAALGGAGFAFTENLVYFQEVDLHIIFLRATYCVVGHMFWSSAIAYGYVVYKFKYKGARSKLYIIPLAFIMAASAHGLYDFFIFEQIGVLSIFFFIGSLHLFVVFQNNALNISNYFSNHVKLKTRKIGVQLIFGLITVFMYQYSVIGLRYGNNDANNMLIQSAMPVSFMLAYLTYTFTQIKITKGKWLKLTLPSWMLAGNKILANFRLRAFEGSLDENHTGLRIRLFAPKSNPYLGGQLPVTGVLIDKIEVSGRDNWYVVLLDSPLKLNNCLTDRVIIRHKNKGQSLKMDKVLIFLMMIPSEEILFKPPLQTKDLLYTGRVYSRVV